MLNQNLVPKGLLGTKAAGEIVLAASEPFHQYHLQMYRKISMAGTNVDYLITKGEIPVLAIKLMERISGPECENYRNQWKINLPLVLYPLKNMENGLMEEIISGLTNLLEDPYAEDGAVVFPEGIDPIPRKHHSEMARMGMIQLRHNRFWEPTRYGRSLGIVDGYLPAVSKKGYRHTLFILSQHKDRLAQALAWPEKSAAPSRTPLSWEQSRQLALQGLPRFEENGMRVVQDFASMPLAEFHTYQQKDWAVLDRELNLTHQATYQEAAERVFQFCLNSDGTFDYEERCKDLIFALTAPILIALNPKKEYLN